MCTCKPTHSYTDTASFNQGNKHCEEGGITSPGLVTAPAPTPAPIPLTHPPWAASKYISPKASRFHGIQSACKQPCLWLVNCTPPGPWIPKNHTWWPR